MKNHSTPRGLATITSVWALAAMVVLMAGGGLAEAQVRVQQRRGGPATSEGVSPGEIQRLFDAYVVMQAQQELQLSDEQYPKFLSRVKALDRKSVV